jgi:hypothetical protein
MQSLTLLELLGRQPDGLVHEPDSEWTAVKTWSRLQFATTQLQLIHYAAAA